MQGQTVERLTLPSGQHGTIRDVRDSDLHAGVDDAQKLGLGNSHRAIAIATLRYMITINGRPVSLAHFEWLDGFDVMAFTQTKTWQNGIGKWVEL
jgi:hypothetical protein